MITKITSQSKGIKKRWAIYLTVLVLVLSCHVGFQTTKTSFTGGWKEKSIEFINSIPHADEKGTYFDLLLSIKWEGIHEKGDLYMTNTQPFTWIRNPNHIITVHKTLKKIGFKEFISNVEYNKPMQFHENFGGVTKHEWEGLSISQVIDSLLFTHQQNGLSPNYYTAFWKRRKLEKNDKETFTVLNEIKDSYQLPKPLKFDSSITNDTLETLLKMDLALQKFGYNPTKGFILDYFEYLRSIGLNHSAYNLVMEKYPGHISADSVSLKLHLTTVTETTYWQTRNKGTWIFSYRDSGP